MIFPDSYAQSALAELLIADGMNPVKIWDGLTAEPIDAGVEAPTVSLAIADGGSPGRIFGSYAAYCRFLDAQGNVSSLNPISSLIEARVPGGNVIGATYTAPIVIQTDAPHGLTSGDIVDIESVQGTTSANGTWEVTVIDSDHFELDGSDGDNTYTAATGTWTSGADVISYSDVPVPTSAKVVRKQILRNTDGQLSVFYVDVDTTDIAETDFESDLDDNELATQTAVPLLSEDGAVLANAHDFPPNYKCILAPHLGRMFLAVDRIYREGAVVVTNASTTVAGIGTTWTAALAGRFLFVDFASRAYEIESVDVAAQTLTLVDAYEDSTAPYALYGIRPEAAQRRLVWYTPPTQPQSWSPLYALEVQEDGDEFTGLMQKGSFLYILERRHIYRFTFQSDPAIDGFVYLSCQRGCVNNRCWVQVEDTTLMLDYDGIHAFDGGQQSTAISSGIQLIFQTLEESEYVVNWNAQELFHAAHFPGEEVVRWFISMGSNLKPRHAIAFQYRTKRWWLEEYPTPVTASALGSIGSTRTVFLGSESAQTITASVGHLDGIDKNAGTTAGSVSSADLCSISDNTASFPPEVVGLWLTITDGKGKLQRNQIHAVENGIRLKLTLPWRIIPDSTSTYQIAGINYRYVSQTFDWVESESDTSRKLALSFYTSLTPSILFFRHFRDQSLTPYLWRTDTFGGTREGVTSQAGHAEQRVDLAETGKELPTGWAQQRMDGFKDKNVDGNRQWYFEMVGACGADGVSVSKFVVDGVQ